MSDDYSNVASLYDFLQREFPVEKLVAFIFRYFGRKGFRPKSVLDIGCGTGSFVVELCKKGLRCSGLDASQEMISVARKKSKDVNFFTGDMADFLLKDKVDLVTAISSPLYMGNFDKSRRASCFSSVFKNLNTPGYFVFDILNFGNFESCLAKKSRKFPITSKFEHEGVSYNTSIDYANPDKISLKIFKSEGNSLVLEQVYERSDADVLKRELLAAGFSDVYVTINKMGVHKDYLVFAAKP